MSLQGKLVSGNPFEGLIGQVTDGAREQLLSGSLGSSSTVTGKVLGKIVEDTNSADETGVTYEIPEIEIVIQGECKLRLVYEVDGVESSFEEAYQIRFEKYNAFQQWFVSAWEVTVWAVPLMVLFVGNSSWHSRFCVLLCVAFLTFYWAMTHWDPGERFMDDPVVSNIEKDTRFVAVPIVLSVAVLFAVVISLLPIRKMWHSQRKSSAHLQYVYTTNLAHY